MKIRRASRSRLTRSPLAPLIAVVSATLGLSFSASSPASASDTASKPLTVAATIINITGGSLSNATVGVPPAQTQENDWNLVANSINKSNGAGGHKLAMQFFYVNPLDTVGERQVCLNIAAAQPFIVVDAGVLTQTGGSSCIPAHHIPLVSNGFSKAQLTQSAPYYLNDADIPEDGITNGIHDLKQLGWFGASKGFKKLGIVYQDCTPQSYSAERSALSAVKVPNRSIVTFDLGCPSGRSDTAASMEQAALSFKDAGVTDVTEVDVIDFALFTQVAAQQDYKPQYLLTDSGLADVSSHETGSGLVNAANFSGAVDIVTSGYGEANTPGLIPSAGTKKCNAIYKAGGQPNVYTQADGYGGDVCDFLWLVQGLLQHDPSVHANGLRSDMHALKAIPASYPNAPIDFSASPADSGYGVSDVRPIFFHASCVCFQVPNPTWHPPFS